MDATTDLQRDARQRLLEAALIVFGDVGYEAASTRALAKQAGTNLSSILYHFGGKPGLYQAVAEHVADGIARPLAGTIAEARAAAADPSLTPERAEAVLLAFVDAFARAMLADDPQKTRMVRFVLREMLDPSEAFDTLHGRVMGPMHRCLATLLARVAATVEPTATSVVRALTLLGQVMIFRICSPLAARSIGWTSLGEAEADTIRCIVLDNARAILASLRAGEIEA